jgi:Recombinase
LQSYWEIKNNHYRVMLKLEGKHLEGVKLGAVPVGYKPQCALHPCRCGLHGKHVPNEPWASWVQELFARYAAGQSLRSVRQWWNAQTGERTSHIRIKDMLRNPYYVGIIVNRRTYNGKVQGRGKRKQEEWKVGTHDYPLLDLRTFATVQERLRTQENGGQERHTYPADPLVGLMHCASCRCRLRRKIDTKARKRGRETGQWECPICNLSRSQLKVQARLDGLLATIPFPEDAAVEDYAQQQARLQQALEQELKAIASDRDRHNRRRSVWADALGDGTMSKEDYRTKIAESDRQLEELRRQEAALRDSHIAQPGRAVLLAEVREALRRMGNWTSTIELMTVEERRGLYRALIKAVRLDLQGGSMTVEYTDALARWCGRASDMVELPSQKSKDVDDNAATRREKAAERARRYRARKREQQHG